MHKNGREGKTTPSLLARRGKKPKNAIASVEHAVKIKKERYIHLFRQRPAQKLP
jgi:hypothetical protein